MFESSERDRLSEKKEKLLVIQNMVRLTKQLSDLDDELERKKKEELTDTKVIYLFSFVKISSFSFCYRCRMKKKSNYPLLKKSKYFQYLHKSLHYMNKCWYPNQ